TNGTTIQNTLFGNYIIKTTTTTGSITTALKKSPLLPIEWEQAKPYNQSISLVCPTVEGGKAYTGCVATATAQIMAYWKYPAQVNWTLLNKYTERPNAYPNVMGKLDAKNAVGAEAEAFRTQVANLMKEIGNGVGMKYGCDGSSAQTYDAVSFMKRLGYKGGSSSFLNIYNFPETYNSVYQDKPVLISGQSKKVKHKFLGITIYTTYKGHAWVVDGYLRQQQQVTVTVQLIKKSTGQVISQSTHTGYNYINFLHNNWGWRKGVNNGYYVEGAFNANAQELSSGSKKTLDEGQAYNYQYQIKIYPGIYKP
ncbi:MAG: C10 family peptidase, partial [Flavobacteriaceae bacterium]|nr:C10 family peptidase [Flavobacteriaceae bacterium]